MTSDSFNLPPLLRSEAQVNAALAFYAAHQQEIDEAIASEVVLESAYNV